MPEPWSWEALGSSFSPGRILVAAVALVGGWGLSWILRRAIAYSAAGRRMAEGVLYSLSRVLHYAIMSITVVAGLALMGINVNSIAVAIGALGIGIGFGLQTIASNFVSGLILLFERPIQVGDRVSIGDASGAATNSLNGYVRAIKLRATTIETLDNIALIVPNSEFVSRTVINWSHGQPRIRLRLNIGVAYGSDLDLVSRIIAEVAREHPETLAEPEPEVRLVATGDSALEFQVLVWIPDPRLRGRVDGELRLEMVRRFRAAGVTIPFPQRDVRIVESAAGAGRGKG